MIHLYCGDGKGKTTAACGLTLRAVGSGWSVLFAQFFKDGSSSEISALALLQGVELYLPSLHYGRFRTMTSEQKAELGAHYREMFTHITSRAEQYDLIVLDEVISACAHGMLPMEKLIDFLQTEGKRREFVLTGRNPAPAFLELADYVTEMKKRKHPFDVGIPARKGIEY